MNASYVSLFALTIHNQYDGVSMDGMKRRPNQMRQPSYRSPDLRITPRRPVSQTVPTDTYAHSVNKRTAHPEPPQTHLPKQLEPTKQAHAPKETAPSKPIHVPAKDPKSAIEPPSVTKVVHAGELGTTVVHVTPHKKKRHAKYQFLPIYALAGLVLVVGGWLAYQAYRTNQAVDTQVARLTDQSSSSESSSTNLPTDEKPKDANFVSNYKVAPLVPQTITIKKINVFARTLQVGTDKEGRMDVPKTAYDAAWYTGSSRPGELGAMVINGHVQGVGGPAIFTKLGTLVAGDVIGVKRGDGQQFSYTVVATEHVAADKVNMAKLLVSQNTAKPGLNLITCGGDYDNATGQFAERTIIYAVQA